MIDRRLVKRLAVFEALGLALITATIWTAAHANGGTITLDITQFGERWVELAVWVLLTPILVLGLHYSIEDSAELGDD